MSPGPDDHHWFEPIAEHLGAAYLRYSFTKGTRQEVDHVVAALRLRPGERVLDVGCGPGRHAHELARRGLVVHGVDISARFIELARAEAPDGATFERLDARELRFTGEFDAVICLCQGAFGLMTADGGDRSVIVGIANAMRPGGRLALSAFSAYYAVKYHTEATFDADLGVAHERMEVRDPDGRRADFDGWTGCYTPRELRLLLSPNGLVVERISSVEPGAYGDDPPTTESPEFLVIARQRVIWAGSVPAGGTMPAQNPWWHDSRPDEGSIAIEQGALLPSYPASGAPVPGRPPGIREHVQSVSKVAQSLSDTTAPTSAAPANSAMGTFDEEGNYTPREVVVDDLGMSFADAIDGTMVEVEDGQLVNGTIVKIDKDEVLLDIGYKSEGVIPARELSIRNDVDPNEIVSLGEKVEALVLQKEDKEGRLLLSKKRAQYERAWGNIERLKEEDGIVEGPVIEVVKGGLIVDIGLRGFLPASLVELRRVRDLQPYVGQRIQAKIIELDKNRNNVVLSRRAYLEETQKESHDQFLNNLKVGEVRTGTVSSVVSFGAFVDLGGMDGLIHVSELSWKHVDHPGSVVAVGDEVTVQVLDVDLSRERISLSLKATQQDPWQEFASTHEVGQLVYGRVTKLVQFGAFVQVGDGIEGLVHISEMSTHHVDSPDQVVTPGEELWVKIIDLDLARRRISLSIKQAAEGGELAEEYREHFEVDEHGNWMAGDTDAEREAAWSEYYGDEPPDADAADESAAEAAGVPDAEAAAAGEPQAESEPPAGSESPAESEPQAGSEPADDTQAVPAQQAAE